VAEKGKKETQGKEGGGEVRQGKERKKQPMRWHSESKTVLKSVAARH